MHYARQKISVSSIFCARHLFCVIKFSVLSAYRADHMYDETNKVNVIFLLLISDFTFCVMRVKGGN